MSFGVSEAFNALKIVLDLAIKLKNEGKELALIEKELRRVQNQLGLIQSRMNNPKSPLGQPGPKMYPLCTPSTVPC